MSLEEILVIVAMGLAVVGLYLVVRLAVRHGIRDAEKGRLAEPVGSERPPSP